MFQITDHPENDYQPSCVHQFCTDVFVFILSSLLWLLEQLLSTCFFVVVERWFNPQKYTLLQLFARYIKLLSIFFMVLVGIYKFLIAWKNCWHLQCLLDLGLITFNTAAISAICWYHSASPQNWAPLSVPQIREEFLLVDKFCADQWECFPKSSLLCRPIGVFSHIWGNWKKRKDGEKRRKVLPSHWKVKRMHQKRIQK